MSLYSLCSYLQAQTSLKFSLYCWVQIFCNILHLNCETDEQKMSLRICSCNTYLNLTLNHQYLRGSCQTNLLSDYFLVIRHLPLIKEINFWTHSFIWIVDTLNYLFSELVFYFYSFVLKTFESFVQFNSE